MANCGDCRYLVTKCYEFSNLTVECTKCFCMTNKHPVRKGWYRFYNRPDEGEFANQCDFFIKSICVNFDVNLDEEFDSYFTDEIQKKLYISWAKSSECPDKRFKIIISYFKEL